ncbi:hypothetical protein MHBO_004548 [Bonamia ostreae]|uniref:Uncharacterized protein n=1 Tax=Bonamia ostreae TaxID=126728 RepID=A0ABV2ATM4_9EUKA
MSDMLLSKGIKGTKVSEANSQIKEDILATFDLRDAPDRWESVCTKIKKLWEEEAGLKIVYENRAMFQLPGAGDYFINKAEEIGKKGYFPTQDVWLNHI